MVNWLSAFLLTLSMVSGILLRYMPFASIVEKKQKKLLVLFHTMLCIVNILVIATFLYSIGLGFVATYLRFGGIIFAAVAVLINMLVIRGRLREHLFVFGIVLNCNYHLMTIPNFIFTMLSGLTVIQSVLFLLISYLALLVLTYWPLMKLLNNTVTPFLHLDSGNYWNTVWLIPLAYFGAKFISLGGEHNSGSTIQVISSLLSGLVIVFMCLSIATTHGRMQEKMIMEKQLSDQKLHYADLQARVENARKTHHDFKHHIAVIRHYMEMDDKDGLAQYCDEWMIRHDGGARIPYTGNSVADGLVYQYIQLAEQQQIEFQYAGSILSHGIADMDLCVLLGNALDNAFTACLTVPNGRKVSLICQSEAKLLSIVVRNSFDGKVQQDQDGILSRKRENRAGVGLSSMRSICEKYSGNLEIQWDENTFTAMILLPLE